MSVSLSTPPLPAPAVPPRNRPLRSQITIFIPIVAVLAVIALIITVVNVRARLDTF